MSCDEVREQLAEHLLGTLEPSVDAEVRLHLRGCAPCRRDMAALAEGVGTLAAAAHDIEPPPELRDRTLAVIDEEWQGSPGAGTPARHRASRWRTAAAAAALVAAVAWGAIATGQALRFEDAADKYESFLGVLGGEAVRVGEFHAAGPQELEGSVVIYDSRVGQSWVLVLMRAPGWEGTANVTMLAGERRIELHPMEFGGGGEASTWLVTASDLRGFDEVNVWDERGVIASADVERA